MKCLREEYEIEHNKDQKPEKEDLPAITKKFYQRVLELLTIHKVPYSKQEGETINEKP